MLDGKTLRVEIDPGFTEGRQYGKGQSGGQHKFDNKFVGRGGRGRGHLVLDNTQNQHQSNEN